MDPGVLNRIAATLNREGILWALGGSLVLNHYGLGASPNDIDLIVALEDVERADTLLQALGEKREWVRNSAYATRYFGEYRVGTTEIDVMAGLRINHEEGCYAYMFDADAISARHFTEDVEIPFTALEDWYVLYQLIPGRMHKADIIEEFLYSQGTVRRDRLERASQGCLPHGVRERIRGLMGKTDGADSL